MIRSGVVRRDSRLSQLPWRPRYRFALLSDPGRTSTPYQNGVSMLSPLPSTRRLPQLCFFRDSITRLHGSLPTLEDAITGRQPRLASDGWLALVGRDGSRRVSIKTFSCSLRHAFLSVSGFSKQAPSPSFRALAGARGFILQLNVAYTAAGSGLHDATCSVLFIRSVR